ADGEPGVRHPAQRHALRRARRALPRTGRDPRRRRRVPAGVDRRRSRGAGHHRRPRPAVVPTRLRARLGPQARPAPAHRRRRTTPSTRGEPVSHSDLNPVNPANPKRAAIVISNPAVSTSTGWPVGFWWSELTHPHYAFTEAGWQVDIYSPDGGNCEGDAMSDPDDASGWQAEDQISRGYKNDPTFRKLIENTRPVVELDVDAYDTLVI